MTDLSLVLLEDITEELKKRFDGFVLITTKRIDNNTDEIDSEFSGGKAQVLGMLDFGREKMLNIMFDEETDQDDA